MTESGSVRHASRHFLRLLRQIEGGREFVITRNGEPVARLSPVRPERRPTRDREAALARSIERMRRGYHLGGETFNRDATHER